MKFISILRAYHGHLVGLAKAADVVGRQIELGTQITPWLVGPLFIGGLVCFLADPHNHLGQRARLAILIPFGAISIIGMAYVGAVFLICGARTDLSRAKQRRYDS